MALGDALMGPQLPPQRPNTEQGSPLAPQGGLKGFLSRPEVMAFLLQSAATMLSGGSIGRGLGEGAAAIGRYAGGKAQADAEAAKEARRQWEWQQEFDLQKERVGKIGGGGRGSGGGGSGKATFSTGDTKALAKMLYDSDLASWKERNKAYQDGMGDDPGPAPDILDYNLRAQKIAAAQSNGMPLQMYNDLRVNGRSDQAEYVANLFATNPAEARKMMQEFQNPQVKEPPSGAPGMSTPAPAGTMPPPQIPGGSPFVGGMPNPFTPPYLPGVSPDTTQMGDATIPSLDPLVLGPLGADPWGMPERQKKPRY